MSEPKKFDTGKPRVDLVPPYALLQVARVLAYGANKYGDRNWEGGISYGRLYAALWRHMLAWWMREEIDEESGLPHLAHAACNAMMLLETHYRLASNDLDDRPTTTEGPDDEVV